MSAATIYQELDPERIVHTIARLARRIGERFPDSGISRICNQLLVTGRAARDQSCWIARPIFALRFGIGLLIAVIVAVAYGVATGAELPEGQLTLLRMIELLEAGINDIIFIGLAILFLVTLERRVKRRRALAALHELRSIAHIIDMHQLDKDPDRVHWAGRRTASSPESTLDAFELARFFDYCSEMLSLTGKIAALYVQRFDDAVALAAVNEIETLTTGLSRKIWQKRMILGDTSADSQSPDLKSASG